MTSLILNVSPAKMYFPETLSTLRFGQRAQNIVNNPKVNKEPSIAELQAVIARKDLQILALEKKIRMLEA
jgi:kinesin family member 5